MNLILFSEEETRGKLPLSDARAVHVLEVLRRGVGEKFDVGIVNGPRGKAEILGRDAGGLSLRFEWFERQVAVDPLVLIVGMPRPQTARRILREATALGVAEIHFVGAEKSDAGYARSTLWSSGEWRRHLVAGAEQAFSTDLPEVFFEESLGECLARLDGGLSSRVALDNYEAELGLGEFFRGAAAACPCAVAVGGERGWGGADRELLRGAGFRLAGLGGRVLRVETAVVAGLALAKAGREKSEGEG